ncbi:haloacid dehalogenase-like hydrolase family member protein [Babesia ovis]|uniref:Haloacid dehalogenase-like hydrolase family member protein n=1 Tax=Babesia ovis TaxID=5869 RepID=A0A9W5TF43_BABOV|nr:haloacid dehalogenase-like hydrolase family member protein [Babesia ovis]
MMDTLVQLYLYFSLIFMAVGKYYMCVGLESPLNHVSYRPAHFAVDIDGTFLTHDKNALEENRKAFSRVIDAGYNMFFCTGRPLRSSLVVLGDEYISKGYKGFPGIYHNGAVVFGPTGNVLRMVKFSKDFLSAFCDYVGSHHLERSVVFCDMYHMYMLDEDYSLMRRALEDIDYRDHPTVVTVPEVLEKNITLIMIGSPDIITNQSRFTKGIDYIMKEGSCGCWDLTAGVCTKAEGLKILLESYNVPADECGFIGNGTNDIEAMDLCGHSFSVNNADPGVSEHAKYHLAESNEEGAFKRMVEIVYGL